MMLVDNPLAHSNHVAKATRIELKTGACHILACLKLILTLRST